VEKKATFGAGCFWGGEAAFRRTVHVAVEAARPSYRGSRQLASGPSLYSYGFLLSPLGI